MSQIYVSRSWRAGRLVGKFDVVHNAVAVFVDPARLGLVTSEIGKQQELIDRQVAIQLSVVSFRVAKPGPEKSQLEDASRATGSARSQPANRGRDPSTEDQRTELSVRRLESTGSKRR